MSQNQDRSYEVLNKLYQTILEYGPNRTDSKNKIPDPPKLIGRSADGTATSEKYLWDVDYIVSGIIKTGNVANIVNEFFLDWHGGDVIANAITSRGGGEQKAVLYSVFTTLNYSLSSLSMGDEAEVKLMWTEAQEAVGGIAVASTFYRGKALNVIKDVADLAFFLLSPKEFLNVAKYLQRESVYGPLNQTDGANLDKVLQGSKTYKEAIFDDGGRLRRDAVRVGWWRRVLYQNAVNERAYQQKAVSEKKWKREVQQRKAAEANAESKAAQAGAAAK